MSLVNAYLVRWARGLVEVVEQPSIDAWGRHEGYLPLGGSQSPADATRVAQAVLAVRAYPQVATTIGLRPVGVADRPFVDFDLGDWLATPDEDGTTTEARVRSITTQDHPDLTGQVQFIPELRNLPAEAEDVLGRWLQRMATGGGAGASVTPPVPIPIPPAPEKVPIPPFSQQQVAIEASGRWYVPEAMRLVRIVASLAAVGVGPTTVEVYLNDVVISGSSVTFYAAGAQGIDLAVDLAVGDYLTTAVTVAGGAALGLVVQLRAV